MDPARGLLSLAVLAVFVLAWCLQRAINLPRAKRPLQFPLPLLALVYGLSVMGALPWIASWLWDTTRSIVQVPFHTGLWPTVLASLAIVGFLGLKIVALTVLAVLDRFLHITDGKGRRVHQAFVERVSLFYRHDRDRFHLTTRMHVARTILGYSVTIALLLVGALAAILHLAWPDPLPFPLWVPLSLPLVLVLLTEAYLFLDGLRDIDPSASETFSGEEATLEGKELYDRILDEYRHLWEKEILYSDVVRNPDRETPATGVDDLDSSALSRDLRSFSSTFQADEGAFAGKLLGAVLDNRNLVVHAGSLESVLRHVLLAMDIQASQMIRILFVSPEPHYGTDSQISADMLRDGFAEIHQGTDTWTIGDIRETGSEHAVILCLHPDDIADSDACRRLAAFVLGQPIFLVLFDASTLVMSRSFLLGCLNQFIAGAAAGISYLCLSRGDSLPQEYLANILAHDFETLAVPGEETAESIHRVVLTRRGPLLQQAVIGEGATCLGEAIPPALVAYRMGVDQIRYVPSHLSPVRDDLANGTRLARNLDKYLEQDHALFLSSVLVQDSAWELPCRTNRFLVVEDSWNHLPSLFLQAGISVTGKAFIVVPTRRYLLREYFAQYLSWLLPLRIQHVNPIPPSRSAFGSFRTPDGRALSMIFALCLKDVDESELNPIVPGHPGLADAEASSTILDADRLLAWIGSTCERVFCLDEAGRTSLEEALGQRLERRSAVAFDKSGGYRHTFLFRLGGNSLEYLLSVVFQGLEPVRWSGQDRTIRRMSGVFASQVHHLLLPGQLAVLSGKSFRVDQVRRTAEGCQVQVTDILDAGIPEYLQDRVYHVDGIRELERRWIGSNATLTLSTCRLVRSVVGWTEYLPGIDAANLADGNSIYRPLGTPVVSDPIQTRCLTIRFQKSQVPSPTSLLTLAFLLNKTFPSFFPLTHPYLGCCCGEPVRREATEALARHVPALFLAENPGDGDAFHVFEDAIPGSGCIETLADPLSLGRIIEVLYDYLSWLIEENDTRDERLAGVSFGEILSRPGVDLAGARELCRILGGDHPLSLGAQRGIDSGSGRQESGGTCDFCRSPLFVGGYATLPDGRDLCHVCRRSSVTSRGEFMALYQEARGYLEQQAKGPIRKDIAIHFTNAVEVNRMAKHRYASTPGFDSRVVGLAVFKGRARRRPESVSLYFENGAPRWNMLCTLVHELTHVWQHDEWAGESERIPDLVQEGMASYIEYRFALERMPAYAGRIRADLLERSDVYGQGFYLFERLMKRTGAETPFEIPLQALLEEARAGAESQDGNE